MIRCLLPCIGVFAVNQALAQAGDVTPTSTTSTPPGSRDQSSVPVAATPAAPPSAILPAPPAAAQPPAQVEAGPRPAPAGPLQIVTPNATIKFGFLLQPQYEAAGSAGLDGMAHNLFVRRTRLLVGGTLLRYFGFFFDTDFSNLFKASNTTPEQPNLKSTPGMNVQDAFGTFKPLNEFMVDVGYMLPALSHNALQGATSLYSWDYFANSFRHSNVFGTTSDPIGRDAGIQLRGLIAKGILEYRIGAFQGRRIEVSPTEMPSRNFFRVAGRLQVDLLDPESAFFYAGTYLGAKRILAMPNQAALMGEAGYLFNAINLSPILRAEHRWVQAQTAAVPDETRIGGGLAFWPFGHNINVKAFYTRFSDSPNARLQSGKHPNSVLRFLGVWFRSVLLRLT